MTQLKTTLHHYCYDTHTPEGAADWKALKAKLEPTHNQHCSWGSTNQPITYRNEAQPVLLETAHLFGNQWNEAEETGNRRLFDWYLEYRLTGKHFKQGHWLEITPEMQAVHDTTFQCGYCGKVSPASDVFCTKCLGSQYLEPDDLFLLRLKAVSDSPDRPPLTEAEAAELLPRYNVAQGLGKLTREQEQAAYYRRQVANLIPEAREKAAKLIAEAKLKTEAHTWLLDHGLKILDNCIYYSHTQKFCFGWRDPITDRAALEAKLEGFPYDFEIKTGR